MRNILVNFDLLEREKTKLRQLDKIHQENESKFVKALEKLNYKNYTKTFGEEGKKTYGYYISNSIIVRDVLQIVNKSSLLDLGCGAGVFLSTLKKAGVKTKGYDIDDKLLKYAKGEGLNCYKRDILKVKAKDFKGYKYLYTWEPFESHDLAEQFVANLVKEAKGKTLIYRGHGIIGTALDKRKDTLKIDRNLWGLTIVKF